MPNSTTSAGPLVFDLVNISPAVSRFSEAPVLTNPPIFEVRADGRIDVRSQGGPHMPGPHYVGYVQHVYAMGPYALVHVIDDAPPTFDPPPVPPLEDGQTAYLVLLDSLPALVQTTARLAARYGQHISGPELARESGINPQTIRKAIRKGEISAARARARGQEWVFTVEQAARFIESSKQREPGRAGRPRGKGRAGL